MEEDEEEIEGVDGGAVEDQGGEGVCHWDGGGRRRTERLRPIQLN